MRADAGQASKVVRYGVGMDRAQCTIECLVADDATLILMVIHGRPPPATSPSCLSPAQRDLLIAPLKEHWNSDPSARPRLMQRAQRWQRMTPEERARAHRGFDRWEAMDPAKREAMRALFHAMRDLTPAQRMALRQQWRAMTPAQREAWVQAQPPSGD